jgi:hypothetical protein
LRNPVLGCNVYILERRIVEDQKIRIKTTDGWRQRKSGRCADTFPIFAETQEKAHRFCPQSIGGLERKRRRFPTAQIKFPDMVVEIVRNRKAGIRREAEAKRVAGSE